MLDDQHQLLTCPAVLDRNTELFPSVSVRKSDASDFTDLIDE